MVIIVAGNGELSMPVLAIKGHRGASRRATNITLPEALLREAKALDLNVSQACELGLANAVARAKSEKWLEVNRAAMAAWNAHVEEHGLPLAEFRQF
jgi:antitoxin CcdA